MRRTAIIGTGIAGLGCAWFLRGRRDLTLFERNDYPGGHTNTVEVKEAGRLLPVDTGFMVFNQVTYPLLTRLFRELGVQSKPTAMSFSVQHRARELEYSGTSLNHLFAQRSNLLRPRHWRFLFAINRFNEEALPALKEERFAGMTVGDYVRERGYGDAFLEAYLLPMSSAVWSAPPERMLDFPIRTLLRFFHNHGFLGLHTQHPWLTLEGGARTYVRALLEVVRPRLETERGVVRVERRPASVRLHFRHGAPEDFDEVILASHADQALRMLENPEPLERELLGCFSYQPNLALLHTDASAMPRRRLCWAAWNYRVDHDGAGRTRPATIYWMNRLQGVSERQNYFVTINGGHLVHPDSIIRRIAYEHPLFDLPAIRAQARLPELNRNPDRTRRLFYCGSYFRHGFHEDAFVAALGACREILGEPLWN